jgi:hypothetical protein
MRALDQNDVVRLLRSEVKRAGGQKEWARKSGVVASMVSMVLSGDRPPNEKIISALKLRRVVIFETSSMNRTARGGASKRRAARGWVCVSRRRARVERVRHVRAW